MGAWVVCKAAPFLKANLPDDFAVDMNVDVYDVSSASTPTVRWLLFPHRLCDRDGCCGGGSVGVQLVEWGWDERIQSVQCKLQADCHHEGCEQLATVSRGEVLWNRVEGDAARH
jgi:hypothetical protein